MVNKHAESSERRSQYMTVREVATRLSLSTTRISQLCREGRLKAFQRAPLTHWRIERGSVEAWMDQERVEDAETLSPKETARLLRYSTKHVIYLCQSGKIEAARVRNRWRIRRETVAAMLEGGREA